MKGPADREAQLFVEHQEGLPAEGAIGRPGAEAVHREPAHARGPPGLEEVVREQARFPAGDEAQAQPVGPYHRAHREVLEDLAVQPDEVFVRSQDARESARIHAPEAAPGRVGEAVAGVADQGQVDGAAVHSVEDDDAVADEGRTAPAAEGVAPLQPHAVGEQPELLHGQAEAPRLVLIGGHVLVLVADVDLGGQGAPEDTRDREAQAEEHALGGREAEGADPHAIPEGAHQGRPRPALDRAVVPAEGRVYGFGVAAAIAQAVVQLQARPIDHLDHHVANVRPRLRGDGADVDRAKGPDLRELPARLRQM